MKPYLIPPGEDDLFAHARRTDPQTSRDAAASVQNITTAHSQILGILRGMGPLTDEQIYQHMTLDLLARISESGCRSRRSELVNMVMVRDTGERRLTKTGRKSIVWGIRP